jgi:TRAP-type uncharacterized transport system fused permease subunit
MNVLWATASAMLALVAVAAAATGWLRHAVSPVERVVAAAAAVLLFIPKGAPAVAGALLLAVVVARQGSK